MAVNYLGIPPKATSDVDLTRPMRKFIKASFGEVNPEDYDKGVTEFQRLRSQAVSKSNDKHESAIEAIAKYYDQFVAVEQKLPFTEDQVRVGFVWYDAFAKGSLLSGKPKLSIASGSFEKACTLYNIAAVQSQVASVQSRDSDEGLKLSAKLFQQSAGILKYLKDSVLSMIGRDPTSDMHPDTLSALSALMLAQAQESIYQKCSKDKLKDATVAKIAMQCSDYFADALKLLQIYSVKDIWPKEWIVTVAGKQAAFHALAEYYQSGVAKLDRLYGEEIARLQHAKELTQSAVTRGGREINLSNQLTKIETALRAAIKDNDFIYHDRVPNRGTLNPIPKASVAKPLPLPDYMSSNFKDCMEKLVPLAVHSANAAFEGKKNQLVSMEIGRLREATHTLNTILASLNLPAAIEDVSGTDVPASVVDKCNKIREMGGIQALNKLMSDLPELLTRNKEILDESFNMLDEEAASDLQLKEQFAEKWNRTPSDKLTAGIRTEGVKYRSILENAVKADTVVREKYETHKSGFNLLSQPVSAIKDALPAASSGAALKDSASVKQLRSLMTQTEDLKAQRTVLEDEIKNVKADMLSQFMSTLTVSGGIDEVEMSNTELQKLYGSLQQKINDSIALQESVVNQIQAAHQQFSTESSSNQSGARRDQILRELAAAFDAYTELKNNLTEGTKFYNDLTQILIKYQNKISDLCFARKTEKEELMKDLNQQIANRPSESAPTAPTYQRPAPARPPPPQASQSAAAPKQPAPPQQPAAPVQSTPPPKPPHTNQPSTSAPGAAAGAPEYPPQQNPQGQLPYSPSPYPYYPPMPTGYNPYAPPQPAYGSYYPPQGSSQPGAPNAYASYPQQGYPPQGYPQQGYPSQGYLQQQYPGYPQQGYPSNPPSQ